MIKKPMSSLRVHRAAFAASARLVHSGSSKAKLSTAPEPAWKREKAFNGISIKTQIPGMLN